MTLSDTTAAAVVNAQEQQAEGPRLHGFWLTCARTLGVLMLFLVLVFYIITLPAYYTQIITSETLHADFTKNGFFFDFLLVSNLVLSVLFVASYTGIAGIIFWRKSNEWIAMLSAFTFLLIVLYVLTPPPEVLNSNAWLNWLFALISFLQWTSFLAFLLLFPNGKFVPRWTRFVLLGWIALQIPWNFFPSSLLSPQAWPAPFPLLVELGTWATGFCVQLYRYRRISNQVQRQQTKWVIFGVAAWVLISFGGLLPGAFFPSLQQSQVFNNFVVGSVEIIAYILIPLSIGIAILRYRLWDIDVIINRTLVYGTLTACVIGIYALIVGLLGVLLQAHGNLLISLLATGLIAVLFQPLRTRLQKGVNRLLYGQRDEPHVVLLHLNQRLEATLAPDAVLPAIVETVAQALKLPYAAILLKQEHEFAIAASYGKPVGKPLTFPLNYQAEYIGELHLAPRSPNEAFTPADLHLLDELARQAGLVAHAVLLAADLQRARERLVLAREEERRRLRRDLHDGIGPTLASLFQRLDTAGQLIPSDPNAAVIMVERLKEQMKITIADIRRLVYALRPPVLDELGLISALREHATTAVPAHLQVSIEASQEMPPLPAAIEVAVYRIVLEALTNVERHAHAQTCLIRLNQPTAGCLCLEILDDGSGLPEKYHAGVGLMSMRERSAELGGECQITTRRTGGTQIRVLLPIPKE